MPVIPDQIEFAGVSIHLTQQSRLQIRQEVQRLYTDPAMVQSHFRTLQQLTPVLKPLLTKAGLPDDFRFVALPFPDVDTLGYWALSSAQARQLNLRVNAVVDERYHPLISAEAVLSHMAGIQRKQHNYVLSLQNYLQWNRPSIAQEQTDSTHILLSPQSPPLLLKMLARKLVMAFEEPNYRSAANYVLYKYRNGAGQTFKTISRRLHINEERIKPFNQWLKTTAIPTEKEYPVLIQVMPDEFSSVQLLAESGSENDKQRLLDTGFPVLVKLNKQETGLRSTAMYYEINERQGVQAQNCDNAITLAYYGKISVDDFLTFNDLTEHNDNIQPGQIYYLERKAKRARIPFHIVQKNQTLPAIANMYGIRLASLLKFNRITPTQRLQPGRLLWLQTKRPANQPVEYTKLPAEDEKTYPEPESDSIQVKAPELSLNAPDTLPADTRPLLGQSMRTDSLAIPADSLGSTVTAMDDDSLAHWDTLLIDMPKSGNELQNQRKIHIVRAGQTYYAISRLYGVTVQQLYAWNKLSERIPLKVGQPLIIQAYNRPFTVTKFIKGIRPGKAASAPVAAIPKRKAIFYTVHPGQTLYRIAVMHKVDVKNLVRWNNLRNTIIEVGQILLIWK